MAIAALSEDVLAVFDAYHEAREPDASAIRISTLRLMMATGLSQHLTRAGIRELIAGGWIDRTRDRGSWLYGLVCLDEAGPQSC
jgi:hypothetical protein